MNMILKLTRIFFKEIFSNGDFFENTKTGKKKVGKIIGYTILMLYCIGVFGFMYITVINSIHNSLASIGLNNLTPVFIGLSAFMLTFIFGFMVSISTYVTSANEEVMLSMPIKMKDLFTAKYLCCYLNELILGFAIVAIGLGIYGFHEKLLQNPLFYLEAILSALVIPLLSVGICYLILVVLLGCFKILRNKNMLMTFSSVIIVAFFLIFYFSFQKYLNNSVDVELLISGAEISALVDISDVVAFFPPIKWFALGFSLLSKGEYLKSFGYILLLVILCVSIPLIILPLLAPMYKRSLVGFNEAKVKKIQKGKEKEFIKSDIKETPILFALFKRDVSSVLRESSWFANGPLSLIIFPVIFGISFVAGFSQTDVNIGKLFSEISVGVSQLRLENSKLLSLIMFWISFGAGLFACLMGTMTSISPTSISREGKGFQNILALPFPIKTLIKAKMLHAMLYSVISSLVIFILLAVVAIWAKVPLLALDYVLIFVNYWWFSLVAAFLIHLIDMLIDVCHPKLTWENPTAVFKQNLMTVVAIFLSWGIIALFVVIVIFLLPTTLISLLVMNAVLTIIAIPLWMLFLKFSQKRLENLY